MDTKFKLFTLFPSCLLQFLPCFAKHYLKLVASLIICRLMSAFSVAHVYVSLELSA